MLPEFTWSGSSSEIGWYASGDWVHWAAHKSLKGECVSYASDLYSLCMCIIEAVSADIPFHELGEDFMNDMKNE